MKNVKISNGVLRILEGALEIAKLENLQAVTPAEIIKSLVNNHKNSLAATFLESYGIDDTIITIDRKENIDENLSPIFTPRTKNIIEFSKNAAELFGSKEVRSEHLLYTIITDKLNSGYALLSAIKGKNEVDDLLVILSTRLQADKESSTENKPEIISYKELEKFGRNLVREAYEGNIDPLIGREEEIESMLQILSRRYKNNPVILGEAGVGKTHIVEGLALRIAKGDVPEFMKDVNIYTLNLGSAVAGSKFRGEFEERLNKIIKIASENQNIILFIDEIHTLLGSGSTAENSLDGANILKPALARGDIKIIGASTLDEYRKTIETDDALERRFQTIVVDEPNKEEAIEILKGLRNNYEEYHNVTISDEAIESAVTLSTRYITDRFLPDKAIDLIDESCTKAKLNGGKNEEYSSLIKELESIEKEKMNPNTNYSTILDLLEREEKIKETLKSFKNDNSINIIVDSDIVAEVVSVKTGVPVTTLKQTEIEKLLKLEENLKENIVGQNEAISLVSKAVRRNRTGFGDSSKPVSFLFTGPTGVGKTLLAKELSKLLFGSEDKLITINMGEFTEKGSVSKLIGSSAGFVGYGDKHLFETVRKNPYSVILFDEIEKIGRNTEVLDLLLRVLDEGLITDSNGKVINFKNAILIFTSNIGASITQGETGNMMGFSIARNKDEADRIKNDDMKEKLKKELRNHMKPEFINRFSNITAFNKLGENELTNIVRLMLNKLVIRTKENTGYDIEIDESVVTEISKKGMDPKFGARPLARSIEDNLVDLLAEESLKGNMNKNKINKLKFKDEKFFITID